MNEEFEFQMDPGDVIANEIVKQLKDAGISDYMVIFRSPDSLCDKWRSDGSRFWLMGALVLLKNAIKKAFVDRFAADYDYEDDNED